MNPLPVLLIVIIVSLLILMVISRERDEVLFRPLRQEGRASAPVKPLPPRREVSADGLFSGTGRLAMTDMRCRLTGQMTSVCGCSDCVHRRKTGS